MGVIYRYEKTTWKALNSPTSLWLHDLLVTPERSIYACGKGGVLRSPDGIHFNGLDLNTKATFRSMAWFKGQHYVVADNKLYILQGNALTAVESSVFAEVSAVSASSMHLWVAGGQHVAWTEDGHQWQLVKFDMPA